MDDDYSMIGGLDPVEIFRDDNELVKANLNAVQCTALAASDALSAYYMDPRAGVMAMFRRGIRYYSRARDGYATEKYVAVLNRRIEVRDMHPEEDEMG